MNDLIKICFPFAGDTVGGSHISARGLIAALDPSRFKPIVVVQKQDGAIASLFREVGMDVTRSTSRSSFEAASRVKLGSLFGTVGDLPRQVRFLKGHGVDIVHTNDGGTHASWALPARMAGAKLLWHHRADPKARGLRLVAPALANRVLCVSEFALPQPGLYSAAPRAEVLHSPFDTTVCEDRDAARRALLAELRLPDDCWMVAYVGSFIDRKRPLLFVDTIACMKKAQPDRPVHGIMLGEALDDVMQEALKERVRFHGLEDSVHLMGWRKPGTFWIAACDQLLIPAVGEPFGRTLIEAMLVGTPIVATRSGGNIEALRDGMLGILVEAENAAALADGSLALLSDPGTAMAFSRRAQVDARTRFGEKLHVERVQQVYEEMLRGIHGRREERIGFSAGPGVDAAE